MLLVELAKFYTSRKYPVLQHYKCNHCLDHNIKIIHKVLPIICNMDTCGLPDMFTLSSFTTDVNIRQTTHANVT